MKLRHLSLSLLTLLFMFSGVHAEDLLMARTPMTFPETMLKLQDSLKKHQQTLSRVQRVDIGLTSKGYQTDKYRVVFFGRIEEIRDYAEKYPVLVPYLPHKIAIFAEGEETLLVAANPERLFPSDDPVLQAIARQWHQELQAIFADMRAE